MVEFALHPDKKICLVKTTKKGNMRNAWRLKNIKCFREKGKLNCEIRFPKSTIAEPFQRFYDPITGGPSGFPKSFMFTTNRKKMLKHAIENCGPKSFSGYGFSGFEMPKLDEVGKAKIKIVSK